MGPIWPARARNRAADWELSAAPQSLPTIEGLSSGRKMRAELVSGSWQARWKARQLSERVGWPPHPILGLPAGPSSKWLASHSLLVIRELAEGSQPAR